jgi:hypothetical protein
MACSDMLGTSSYSPAIRTDIKNSICTTPINTTTVFLETLQAQNKGAMGLLAAGIIITIILLILIPVIVCCCFYKKTEDRDKIKNDVINELNSLKKVDTYKKAYDDSLTEAKKLKEQHLTKDVNQKKKTNEKDFDNI